MKRMLIAAAMTSMLALAAPGLASAAHKSKCHHHAHRACAKSRHASRARVLTFGGPSSAAPTAGTTGTGTAPTALSTPAEPAGTVASFTGGVLTITLKDGSTVSGNVTEKTEIRCQSATPTPEGGDDDQNGDEASGGNGEDESHGAPGLSSHGDDMSGGGDGQEGNGGQPSTCTTAALVPGAVVGEAELSVGSSGAVWDHVDLIS
jgi:hypothetical protein